MADVPGTYLALERDEWLTSKEGRGCRDATTLGASADQSEYYLQNRLELAFIAGAKAVERWHEAKGVQK